jgi:RNA polymerase-binding transcription factor DksA
MAYKVKQPKKNKKSYCFDCGEEIPIKEVAYAGTQKLCQKCFHYHDEQMSKGAR